MTAQLEPSEPQPRAVLSRPVAVLIATAGAVVIAGGIKAASDIVGPIALALVLTIAVAPLARWVRKKGAPAWVSTLTAMVAVYLVVLILAGGTFLCAIQLAGLLPQYVDRADEIVANAGDALAKMGVNEEPLQQVLSHIDLGRVANLVTDVLGSVLGLASNLFFLVTLLFFLAAESTGAVARGMELRAVKPELTAALARFVHGTQSYLIVSCIFGGIVAIIDTLALWALGVPLPVVWGLLAFLTNFIPNVGFVIGLIPPALLALLDGGVSKMLAVIAVYCVVNVVLQTFIQPRFVGDAVGFSTTLTFISLVLWAYLLGAVGAFLAVPMSLLARALLIDADPKSAWAELFITAAPPDPPDPNKPRKPPKKPKTTHRAKSESDGA